MNTLYVVTVILLQVFAVYYLILWMARLAIPLPKSDQRTPSNSPTRSVTIQLPVFNEHFVIHDLLESILHLKYPKELLSVQILDDSTDDTSRLIATFLPRFHDADISVNHIHRADRAGFKAGALRNGMQFVTTDFVAIFDADFRPAPDFSCKILGKDSAFSHEAVGFVQARWQFINREQSFLTAAQAAAHELHFRIEQPARIRLGIPLHFNGSGGVWRTACILDAGNWHDDSLTEDLDLSYRAQLKGWRGWYMEDLEAPNFLPTHIRALKRQSARWARGSAQVFRIIIAKCLFSNWPVKSKLSGLFHLGAYSIQPLLLLFILLYPFPFWRAWLDGKTTTYPDWLLWISFLSLVFPAILIWTQLKGKRPPALAIRDSLFSLILVFGLVLSNSVAFLHGLLFPGQVGTFLRTPKTNFQADLGSLTLKRKFEYSLPVPRMLIAEIGLLIFTLASTFVMLQSGPAYWAFPPFYQSIIFATGIYLQIKSDT